MRCSQQAESKKLLTTRHLNPKKQAAHGHLPPDCVAVLFKKSHSVIEAVAS